MAVRDTPGADSLGTIIAVLGAVDHPVALIDGMGVTRYANRCLEELLATAPGALEGRALEDWCAAASGRDDCDGEGSSNSRIMRRAAQGGLRVMLRSGDGRHAPAFLTLAALADPPGSTHHLVSLHGLDEDEGVAARARQGRRVSEERNRRLVELLLCAGHDLRTPLTAILGLSDLLLYDHPADGEPGASLQRLRHAAAELERQFTRLIDFVKVEEGRLALEVAAVDPGATVREACRRWREPMRAAGIDFRQAIDDSVDRIACRADQRRLAEAIDEVLGIVHRAGGERTVTVGSVREGERVVFTVADSRGTLLGFGDDDHGDRPRRGDLDLGLRLARGLVEAMAGSLRVGGLDEGEARVELRLPLADRPR